MVRSSLSRGNGPAFLIFRRFVRSLIAMSIVAITVTELGCGSAPPPPAKNWVTDLVVTGADHKPLPQPLTGMAGDAVDVIVSYEFGTPDTAAFPDRKVHEPEKWRLRAEVLDASGALQAAQPIASLSGELHGFNLFAVEQVQTDGGRPGGGAGKIVWESPEPTKEIKKALADRKREGASLGRQYLWGHTRLPDEPGEYRFVIRLYPTADPRFAKELNPEMGPPAELASYPLIVTPREGERPRLTSTIYNGDAPGANFRRLRLRAGGGRGPRPGAGSF